MLSRRLWIERLAWQRRERWAQIMRVLRDGAEHSARSLAARLCLGHYDLGVFLRQLERAGAVESRLVGEKRAYRPHAASGVVAARRGPGLVVSPEQYDALRADLAAASEPGPVPGEFGAVLYEEFDDEGDTDGYSSASPRPWSRG